MPRQNTLELSIYNLKKKIKDRGLFQRWESVCWGGGKYKEREHEGEYDGCILYPYIKLEGFQHKMKPVEIILRGRRENMEGIKLTKIYCKHICKFHNVSP
jgi:hypothetical protein